MDNFDKSIDNQKFSAKNQKMVNDDTFNSIPQYFDQKTPIKSKRIKLA